MSTDEKRIELLSMSKKDLVERLIFAETLWIESVKKRDALEVQLSAYENDLVLLDVADKLKMAEERIAELEEKQRWIHKDKKLIAIKDGNSWCLVLPDFINLAVSDAKWLDPIISSFFDKQYQNLLSKKRQPPKEE